MSDNVQVTHRETKAALVEAGIELLEETGSPDIGLREIARRAGVSHGAPRRWFPTHRSLLAAIAEDGLRELSTELSNESEDPKEQIRTLASSYIDFAIRRPAMFTLIFRHDLLEGSGANLRDRSGPLFANLVALVGRAEPNRDPILTATALWTGIHGIAVLRTTGALGLTAPDVDAASLIEHIVNRELA